MFIAIIISCFFEPELYLEGGDRTWREFMTLPNILKEFNPKLYGYSVGKKKITSNADTYLNYAESGQFNLEDAKP